MQPARDAAVPAVGAVMVLDALAPLARGTPDRRTRQDHGVLARDARLVAVAVERPGLHLALGQRAAVSGDGRDGGCGSARRRPARSTASSSRRRLARVKSFTAQSPCRHGRSPSRLPRRRRVRASFRRRTGLVLLMWTKTCRPIVDTGQGGDRPVAAGHRQMPHAAHRSWCRRRQRSSRHRCRACRRTAAARRRRDRASQAVDRCAAQPGI